MEGSRTLAIVLLLALLLPGVCCLNTALAQDAPTFDTDEDFYMPGDTVWFTGTGLKETCQYNITVDGVEVARFSGTAEGGIPSGSDSWETLDTTSTGTYEAIIHNITDPGQYEPLVTAHFGLWGTDKAEYTYPDVVTISGGGVYPEIRLTLNITNATGVSAKGYPKYIYADTNGEFLEKWDFYNASTGTYTVKVNGTGTYDDMGQEFKIETTMKLTVTAAGRAQSILQDIENKKVEVQGYVEKGMITDLEGSLIAKLTTTAKKIQQAIDWLGTSRDKVARNMLKAAENDLKAFINHVRAQSGKHIDAGVADALIKQAQHLLKLIQDLQEQIIPPLPSGKPKIQPEDEGDRNNGRGKGKENGRGKGKGRSA